MAATRNPRVRLLHIRDEIDGVTAAIKGVSFAQYKASYSLRRTAERAVQIISEAAKVLPADQLARYPEAPWSAIIGIGTFCVTNTRRSTIVVSGTLFQSICRNCGPWSFVC
jgi:uncharacterized protein with HEPN domain